jgi:hypothetical protein
VNFALLNDSALATFIGPSSCVTVADGTCFITIKPAQVGSVVIQGTTTVSVAGVGITRTTGTAANTAAGGSGNAQKTWVTGAVLLIIDEDSIDNGIRFNAAGGQITPSGPNFFTDLNVNDDKPSHTQRDALRYFAANPGRTITVMTGQTGDEGWFAPNCIPQKWFDGGSSDTCLTPSTDPLSPFQRAIDNYFGLNGSSAIPAQSRLDKIPAVMPLRAGGLVSLVGKDVCAVVYDSDISINYNSTTFPFTDGNLQGETLGIVAFRVDQVRTLNGFSSSTLPQVTLTILDSASTCGNWQLFNAPVPRTSSVPNDRQVNSLAGTGTNGYRQLEVYPGLDPFYP